MAKKKLQRTSSLDEALKSAEHRLSLKEKELCDLKDELAALHERTEEIDSERTRLLRLEEAGKELKKGRDEASMYTKDYDNQVLVLELQGLVDRYRLLDVETLGEKNKQLREEVYRLQSENMELSRTLAEGDLKSRCQAAKVELALEVTTRAHLREAQASIRKELFETLDFKTRMMIEDHGNLQAQVRELNSQAYEVDSRYRQLARERQQFKVDAEAASSMNDMMTRQMILLRSKLDKAFIMNRCLEEKIDAAEARVQNEEQSQTTRNDILSADNQGEDYQNLKHKLKQALTREQELCTQRDRWKERCLLHERASAQLQACLSTLLERAKLTLPDGIQQSIESVWKPKGCTSFNTNPSDKQNEKAIINLQQNQQRQESSPLPQQKQEEGEKREELSLRSDQIKGPQSGFSESYSLSRLITESTEPLTVSGLKLRPQSAAVLKGNRSPGSLRYTSVTSALELYGFSEVGAQSLRPGSALDSLAQDRKVLQQLAQARAAGPSHRIAEKAHHEGVRVESSATPRPYGLYTSVHSTAGGAASMQLVRPNKSCLQQGPAHDIPGLMFKRQGR